MLKQFLHIHTNKRMLKQPQRCNGRQHCRSSGQVMVSCCAFIADTGYAEGNVVPLRLVLADDQAPTSQGQPVARLRFYHPHPPVVLLWCRWRLRRSPLFHSPFHFVPCISPELRRRQAPSFPSPPPWFNLLTCLSPAAAFLPRASCRRLCRRGHC